MKKKKKTQQAKKKTLKCSKTLVLNTFIEMVSLFISSDLNKHAERVGLPAEWGKDREKSQGVRLLSA